MALPLVACGPADLPEADGLVDLRATSGARPRPLGGRPAAPGCQPVIDMLPRLSERLAAEEPADRLLDAVDRCLADSGRAAELVRLYLAAIAARPRVTYRYRLAGAFVALGDRGEALRHLDAALATDPDHAPSLFLSGLVRARHAADDPVARRAARDAWRRLLEVAPDYRGFGGIGPEKVRRSVASWSAGLTGDGSARPTPVPGRPEPARPAPAVGPEAGPPPFARALIDGEAALAGRRFDEARRSFEAALARRPEHAGAVLGLARALSAQGEVDAAVRRLEQLRAARPGDVRVTHELGLVLLRRRGDEPAARALLAPLAESDREYARRTGLLHWLERKADPKKR